MTEKDIEKLIRKVVTEVLEEQDRVSEEKKDVRLRNIRILLKNYRSFKIHCAGVGRNIEILDEKIELDELGKNELVLESIRKSKIRTLTMVTFIDKMLEAYKILCEETGTEEDKRAYETIKLKYIEKEKMTDAEILSRQCISRKTLYRDVDRACRTLEALMFGVDSVRVK